MCLVNAEVDDHCKLQKLIKREEGGLSKRRGYQYQKKKKKRGFCKKEIRDSIKKTENSTSSVLPPGGGLRSRDDARMRRRPLVPVEVRAAGEGHPAVGAAVRPLAGVDANVNH